MMRSLSDDIKKVCAEVSSKEYLKRSSCVLKEGIHFGTPSRRKKRFE